MAQRVGVIGLGMIGKPIAERILAAGHAPLELGHQRGVPVFLGTPTSLITDTGIATGHDNPAL
jgi:hypothetical protein